MPPSRPTLPFGGISPAGTRPQVPSVRPTQLRKLSSPTLPSTRYLDVILADDPDLYWRVGETSGTTTVDCSGNGRTGTFGSGVTLGRPGAVRGDFAVQLDGGSNGRVTSPTYNPFVAGSERSFECWVLKLSSATNDSPFGSYDGTVNQNFGLQLIGGGSAVIVTGNQSATFSNAGVPAGLWTHIVLTYSDVTRLAELWYNGRKVGSQTLAGPYNGGAGHFGLGFGGVGGYNMFGDVDEAAVYTYILSSAQIKAHYAAGNPYAQEVRTDSRAIGQWRLADAFNGPFKAADLVGVNEGVASGGGVSINQPNMVQGNGGSTKFTTHGVNLPAAANPLTYSTQVTFEQVVNLQTAPTGASGILGSTMAALWGIQAGSGGGGLAVRQTNDIWLFGVTGAHATWTGAWPGLNQNVHVAVRIDTVAGNAELFINGTSLGVRSGFGGSNLLANGYNIGATGNSNSTDVWLGTMQDFSAYTAWLDDATIQRHYDLAMYGIPRYRMQAWLDPDALSLSDGDAVTTIPNKAPNGIAATQATSAKQPVFKRQIANERSAIRFDSVGQTLPKYLNTGALTPTNDGTQPITFFAVQADSGIAAGRFMGLNSALRAAWNHFVPGFDVYSGTPATSTWTGTSPVNALEWKALSIIYDKANSEARSYTNTYGRLWEGKGELGPAGAASDWADGITIGAADSTGSQSYTGDLGEVIVYDTRLSEYDRMLVEDWLHDRWLLPAFSPARTATDMLATTDAVVPLPILTRAAADTLGTTDSAFAPSMFSNTGSDTLSTTDTAALSALLARIGADTLGTSDAAVRAALLRLRAGTDTLGTSDAAFLRPSRFAIDTLGTTDVATRLLTRLRLGADTLGTSDAATRASTRARLAADALGTADTATRVATLARLAADALNTSDAAVRGALRQRLAADALGTSDAVTRLSVRARLAADALGTSDAASRGAAARLRFAADILGTSDAAQRAAFLAFRAAVDALGTSDSADGIFSRVSGPDLTGPLHVLVLSGVSKALAADYISKTLVTDYLAHSTADEPSAKGIALEPVDKAIPDNYAGKAH